MKFNYDYSQTMVMKLDIGLPDNNGGCKVFNTFDEALEKIKIADALTLGAPKIVYLVGWQYNGHDDKYPAFFEVNKSAKSARDSSARESLLRLVEEAKKYNTVVSYHINLSDAYPCSPLWDEYVKNDLILKNRFGKLKKTGTWNGRTAYQVRFAEEYRSGYFQRRVDKLMELLPLREAGTVHVDAFFVRRGKNTSIKEEKIYRRKMIEYFMQNGVDVTSEFIYRERNSGLRLHFGKSDVIGIIPAFWNLVLSQKDYLRYSPREIAGGSLNMDLQTDKDLQYLFYGNTGAEGCFNEKGDWTKSFTEKFALGSVPYFYLNRHKLLGIGGRGKKRVASFSGGVESSISERRITENGRVIKRENTLCIPIAWRENSYFAWSKDACSETFYIPFEEAEISEITTQGTATAEKKRTENGNLTINFKAGASYEIKGIGARLK